MVTSNSVKRMSDSGVNQPSIMVSFNAKKSRLDKLEFSSETTGETAWNLMYLSQRSKICYAYHQCVHPEHDSKG